MQFPHTDVLVIGSGLAGLYAAINCRMHGLKVLLCSKSQPGLGSCSAISEGVFSASTDSFSPIEHKLLTLKTGKGLNQRDRLDTFVENADHDVERLQELGVDLSPGSTGYHTRSERPGQEGRCITKPLAEQARSMGIKLYFPFFAWRIAIFEERAAGVWGFEPGKKDPVLLACRSVILATGGAGAIYANTDNPQGITGDGYAMALAAGLPLMDMEFIQFYPLCMGKGPTKRLLPSLLGEVGRLENAQAEDIVSKYDIQPRPVAEAARDSLCQAMALELSAGRGLHEGGLRLRIQQKDSVWRKAREVFGLDSVDSLRSWTESLASNYREGIPVEPAAHFCMGGIAPQNSVDSCLSGLFAAGEVTGGLHGANRHGGNALTEAAVFGRMAAQKAILAAKDSSDLGWSKLKPPDLNICTPPISQTRTCSKIRGQLQELMWQKAGLLRSEESLRQALQEVDYLKTKLIQDTPGSRSCSRALKLQNMFQVSEAILRSSLARQESRGSHYRIDHPYPEETFDKHILLQNREEGLKLFWSS